MLQPHIIFKLIKTAPLTFPPPIRGDL